MDRELGTVSCFDDLTFSVLGLDDDSPFVAVAVNCRHCGELLTQNRWDTRIVTMKDAKDAAARDMPLAAAHKCP